MDTPTQMDTRTQDVVIAKSRAKYNEGYMPGFSNDFDPNRPVWNGE